MDNPLQKILNQVSDFFKKAQSKDESVVGIDIGSSSIKVVQLKSKGGKAVLETYGELALGPFADLSVGELTNLPDDKLALAITDALKESEITTRNAGVAIPSASSLVFIIEIPASVGEKDLASIVPTEARKYIPVPISEVSIDWSVIPKKEEEGTLELEDDSAKPADSEAKKTEVLVAAIHNDTLKRYKDALKQANLESDLFEIEIFSNIRASFGHEVSTVMLLDFGASKTKISIVDRGAIRGFHIVNRGSNSITSGISTSLGLPFSRAEELKREVGLLGLDDPAFAQGSSGASKKNISDIARLSVDYILSEINSVVLNYEKKYNKAVSKVILTGGGSLLKGFLDVAAANFRSEVILADPFNKTEAPAFLENILKNIGPEFSVAVGLALRKLK